MRKIVRRDIDGSRCSAKGNPMDALCVQLDYWRERLYVHTLEGETVCVHARASACMPVGIFALGGHFTAYKQM